MKGIISAHALYKNGIYTVKIDCNSKESYELVKRKLRLIGIFVTTEKGRGFL